ncbi:MAG: DUF805 domain-containing protein [Clostridia bacterium]|nr:DUF805 domain-containing protein [Clostridia bacterium]
MYLTYILIGFIPNLSLTVRRLHDAKLSGFLILLNFIPYLGPLIFLFLMTLKTKEPNNNVIMKGLFEV